MKMSVTNNLELFYSNPIYTIGIPSILAILGAGLFLYTFLEDGFKLKKKNSKASISSQTELQEQFLKFKDDINQKIKDISHEDLKNLNIESIVPAEVSDKVDDKVFENFEKKYSENAVEEINWKRIEEYSENLEYNLERYIRKLSRNASVNLIIGVLTTIVAVSILSYLVFERTFTITDFNSVWGEYLPRISISVFIEIFSFFFLKLYRSNLHDVKYFENERTNIKSRLLALKTAYLMTKEESMNLALESLIKTERNFKLKKGETTVDLEKSKLSLEQDSKWMELFTNTFNSKS